MNVRFTSTHARDLREFISFKRARGCVYGPRTERLLLSFDRFVGRHSSGRRPRLKRLIGKWLSRFGRRSRKTVRTELSVIRQFCLFLRRRDPNCYVPDLSIGPSWKQVSRFRPYIFSTDEISLLLDHAETLKPQYRALTFKTMIAVYYCTGIRPGEGTRLRLCDLDLREKTLLVRKSKGKTRWVPFHSDLGRYLRRYLVARRQLAPNSPGSPLFTKPNGRAYPTDKFSNEFRGLLRQLGLRAPVGEKGGPRLYDLRHTHATHVLLQWHQDGVDLQAWLPVLSAYMGHDHLLGTEVYLSATPELLDLASRRYEERFNRRELRL